MIPELPVFSSQHRAWLNGFVAGFLGIEPTLVSEEALSAAGLVVETVVEPSESIEEEFPWHQPELPIVERLELAEGKPLNRKLMAAMAQLDCGSCGYVCQTYSEAIASGAESDLSLCSPGGKETKRMIKQLIKQNGGVDKSQSAKEFVGASTGFNRANPFSAKLLASSPLNKEGSAKDTRKVVIDLAGSNLSYQVGDALGVWPTNCDDLVQSVLEHVEFEDADTIATAEHGDKSLGHALTEDYCLKDPTDELLELLIDRTDDQASQRKLQAVLDDGVPDGFDVLDALQLAPIVKLSGHELVSCLETIKPRLYSIASSMKSVGDQVHLTVGKVQYERDGRVRRGVASTMFAERLAVGDRVRVFVHPNKSGFTTPTDKRRPMIMIGPGTGIAPFIAFLQEREATKATGPNWLFFGDQRQQFDFLYEDQLKAWFKSGLLTRISTAFSRDGERKHYVQDRMQQHAADIWTWIRDGASIFVCGDASRMAADVEKTLIDICHQHGRMSRDRANDYVSKLCQQKRYVRDVY